MQMFNFQTYIHTPVHVQLRKCIQWRLDKTNMPLPSIRLIRWNYLQLLRFVHAYLQAVNFQSIYITVYQRERIISHRGAIGLSSQYCLCMCVCVCGWPWQTFRLHETCQFKYVLSVAYAVAVSGCDHLSAKKVYLHWYIHMYVHTCILVFKSPVSLCG